jgi:hypothetical protein
MIWKYGHTDEKAKNIFFQYPLTNEKKIYLSLWQ